MKTTFVRKISAFLLVGALACLLCLAAFAGDLAPYAESGDMDYIPYYRVTVDPREDGSADITYEIDWQVIDGGRDDYLSWVKIGLANAYADELTALTDTISDIEYSGNGGSYAKITFAEPYYAPDIAAEIGAESRVHFAFSVHQSHLFRLNTDSTADFAFTPGWFDELSVEKMEVRWRRTDGCTADNMATDGDYLLWEYGPLGHGQGGEVHVTMPVTESFDPDAAYSPDDALTWDDNDQDTSMDEVIVVTFLILLLIVIVIALSIPPRWSVGFGDDIDPDDWYWYTNGIHTVRCLRTAPPPSGYHRTDPPKGFKAGGGHSRGGGVGRHSSGGGCASSCACACASSCACACACAGGGRAGCSVKDFYTVKLPRKESEA